MLRYLFLLSFITIPLLTFGQDGEDPSTLLPDIDPQDIEIRGDFSARFPGLTRQPILGFNPKPRVFQMDPDRMPYIESAEEIKSSLPPSDLEQVLSLPRERIYYPEQGEFFGRLGYGNQDSPEARLFGETALSENSLFAGDLNFLSSDNYIDGQQSSFRYLDGRSDWIYRKNNNRVQLGLTGRSDFNYAVPGSVNPTNLNNSRKDYQQIGTHASYRHMNNAYNGLDVEGSFNFFQVENTATTTFSDEQYGSLGVKRYWDGSRIEELFSIELNGEGGSYNTFEAEGLSWYILNASGFYKRNLRKSNFKAGLDIFHAYDDIDEPVSLFIFPNLNFQYTGLKGGDIEITVKSFLENPGLEGVHNENRQLLINPMIKNEQGLMFKADAQYDVFKGARVFGGLNYIGYGSYSYYLFDDNGYSLNYDDDTNIFEASAGFSYDFIPQFLNFYTDVTWRSSNTSEDQPVPFLESFNSTASIYSNPFGKLFLRAWTEYRGSRPINFTEENADGYFLVGAQVDFQITDNFGAYIKGLNLLNQDYEIWQGYQERPAQVYGGLTLHF